MWSWFLAVVGIIGVVIIGQKKYWGFIWMTGVECLWVVFSLQTNQHGFILASVFYVLVYARNAYRWREYDQRRTATISN
jgi:hypothetical protein